jgi:hypothetical protein
LAIVDLPLAEFPRITTNLVFKIYLFLKLINLIIPLFDVEAYLLTEQEKKMSGEILA